MVGDNVVCERWCVKDGGWQSWVWKMVCERWCVTKWCVKEGVSKLVPCLPRKTTVDVQLCHACHVNRRWMSPSATPATQSAAASRATKPDQARHPVPSVPRLPRKTTVDASLRHACHVNRRCMDVTKCHACHAKCRGVPGAQAGPSAPPSAICPTPATQNDGGCEFVPRLPRETKVDVTKCHACHAKCRGVPGDQAGPSAPPSAICPTPATQNDGGCEFVPRLPRESKVDVTKCHACHAKCRGVPGDQAGPSAPPSAICPTPATQNDGGCEFVPRLQRETKVDATKCHACHAKWRGAPGDKSGPSAPPSTMSATPATQKDGGCWVRATPATWNEGGCHQVPRLPRKVARRPWRQIRAKRATQYHECHACHAKGRWMLSSCHACHVKRRWMSPSAMPATQSGAAPLATNPGQARHPVPWVPRLPGKRTVDVEFRATMLRLWMWSYWMWSLCVWSYCMWSYCMLSDCMWSLCVLSLCVLICVCYVCVCYVCVCYVCVCELCVCVKFVYVKLLYVKFVCGSYCMWSYCILSYCMLSLCVLSLCMLRLSMLRLCMWTFVCVCEVCVCEVCVCEVNVC